MKKQLIDWWANSDITYNGLVAFKQLIQSSDSGSGTLSFNNATLPNGAAISKTLGGVGSYVQTTVPSTVSNADAVALCICARDDFNYSWGGRSTVLLAVYHFSTTLYYARNLSSENGIPGTTLGVTVSAGHIIRLLRASTTDISIQRSTDGGANFTTLQTLTVIDNSVSPYPDIKVINAVQGAGKKLESVYGYALRNKTAAVRVLGTIYNKATWPDLTDFTNEGSTSSVVSNAIQFSGGAGTFTQTLNISRYTSLEQWSMTARVKVGTKSGTSFGFGLGIRSSNTTLSHKYNFCARWAMTTGIPGVDGYLILNGGSANTQLSISASALSFSVNDVIEITVTRNKHGISASCYNVTKASSSITATYTFATYPNAAPYLANTGRFAIYSLGGTFTVQSLVISSNEYQNARIVLIGDSKTVGYDTTAIGNRIANLLQSTYTSSVVMAGGSDGLAEYLLKIQELQGLTPKQFLIMGASNDFRAGRTSGNINTDYASLVTQLELSSTVKHTTGLKESVLDQSTLQTYINANYSADNIIDSLGTTITLDSDNVHPTDTGNSEFENIITSSGKIE